MKPFDKVLQEKFESDGMFPLKKVTKLVSTSPVVSGHYLNILQPNIGSDEPTERTHDRFDNGFVGG